MTPQAHLEQKIDRSETQVKQLTASVTNLKLTDSQKLANTPLVIVKGVRRQETVASVFL